MAYAAFRIDDILRAAARHFGLDGLEARVYYRWPPGKGLGALAATAVAITGALATLAGKPYSPLQIATITYRLRSELPGQAGALHSHMAAATGGITQFHVGPYPRVQAEPLGLPAHSVRDLERRLLLVQTARAPVPNLYARLGGGHTVRARRFRETLWQLRALPALAINALIQRDYLLLGGVMAEQSALHQRIVPALLSPEARHIAGIAHRYDALATAVNGTGGSMTILCASGQKPRLESALRLAGYQTTPVRVGNQGLRVCLGDQPCSADNACILAVPETSGVL